MWFIIRIKVEAFRVWVERFWVLCEEGGAGRVSNLGLGSSFLLGWAFPPIIGMFRASGVRVKVLGFRSSGLDFNGLGV